MTDTRTRPGLAAIPAATYPDLYRIVCPDGHVSEDVDDLGAALEAVKYANAMHDNDVCNGEHRILHVHTYLEVTE